MKIKIVINTTTLDNNATDKHRQRTSEIWSGELELFDKDEYLTKISIIAEGKEHPICDVPFSPDMHPGYWMYIGRQPITDDEEYDDENFHFINPEQQK